MSSIHQYTQLQQRPSFEEFQRQNMTSPVAPMLAGAAMSLESQFKRDALSHKLNNRESAEALANQGILSPIGLTNEIAPSLASNAKSLEQSLVKDSLSRSLSHRREASDLQEAGILEGKIRCIHILCVCG